MTGIIAGVEVDLLVDTGSDVTLLDPAVYNQIKREHKPELTEVNCSLNTASGDRMESFGAADFELTLGQQSWEYPFVVAQMGPIARILGNNFLRENNCCLDMGLGTLKVNREVLLLRTERTGSCCRVMSRPVQEVNTHESNEYWRRNHIGATGYHCGPDGKRLRGSSQGHFGDGLR